MTTPRRLKQASLGQDEALVIRGSDTDEVSLQSLQLWSSATSCCLGYSSCMPATMSNVLITGQLPIVAPLITSRATLGAGQRR